MKILIAEDEAPIAEVERAYAEKEGYETLIAADGIVALDLFAREHLDLVILDLMLPGIPGDAVCSEIRKNSSVPIIMVTAIGGEDNVIAGLDAGADDMNFLFFLKSFQDPKRRGVEWSGVETNLSHTRWEVTMRVLNVLSTAISKI